MSRRTSAGVTAVVLLIATWLVATLVPTNYVVYSPGPTVNLLAKEKGGDLVRVSGAKAYRDKGALRLLTVVPTGPDDRVYLAEAMFAWLNPKQAVYRESDIYQPQENSDRVEAESAVDMVNSQDSAIASALHELGYKFGTSVQILGVTRGGPGDGALEVHDKILAVDGARTTTLEAVVDRIRKVVARRQGRAPDPASQQEGDGQGQDRRLRGRPEELGAPGHRRPRLRVPGQGEPPDQLADRWSQRRHHVRARDLRHAHPRLAHRRR